MDRSCIARDRRIVAARTRSVSWLAFCALTLLSLGACESVSTSDRLLALDSFEVDPERGILNVHGRGFPPARPCELTARGKLYEPGRPVREFRRETTCRSISEHTLTASLEAWHAESTSSAVFEGQLQVIFTDDTERLELRGVLPQSRLRLQGPERNTPEQVLGEAHRARSFQRTLGISEVEVQARGLTLTELAAEGPAMRAGLHIGDVVTRVDGAPVELATDFMGQPGLRQTQLEFTRPGRPGVQRAEVRLAPEQPKTAASSTLAFVLGGLIAWLLPCSARTNRRGRSLKHGSVVILLSAALFCVSTLALGALDVRLLWMFPALVHAAVVTYEWRRQRIASHELLLQYVDLGTASLAVAALGILGGSLQLQAVPHGSLEPTSFALFATPTGWLAGVLLLSRSNPSPAPAARSALFLEASKLSALLAFATAPLHSGGLLAMLVLSALLLLLEIPPLPRIPAACLALLALPMALMPDVLSSVQLGPLFGAGLCGMLLATAVRVIWQRRQAPESVLDPRLSPFV